MTPARDRVNVLGFWTDRATRLLPELAWAIDEISKNATLDELCVELEVISGQSAYQTRTVILQSLADSATKTLGFTASVVEYLGEGSSRLGIWCLLASYDAASKKTPTPATTRAMSVLREWCTKRVNYEVFSRAVDDLQNDYYRIPDGNASAQRCSNTASLMMLLAERSESQSLEKSVYLVTRITSSIEQMIDAKGLGRVTAMQEAMREAILVFPVFNDEPSR